MEKSSDMISNLENVFRLCDEDEDGFISIDKFLELIKKHINYESFDDQVFNLFIIFFIHLVL